MFVLAPSYYIFLLTYFTKLLTSVNSFDTESLYPKVKNITVDVLTNNSAEISWKRPSEIPPRDIVMYLVAVRAIVRIPYAMQYEVPYTTTSYVLEELYSHTSYSVRVKILFRDHHHSVSDHIFFSTWGDVGQVCLCDRIGSYNLTVAGTCTPNKIGCDCRQDYLGKQCDTCAPKMYRQYGQPCDSCPCHSKVSDGLCRWNPSLDSAQCTGCKPHRTGQLCQLCDIGYYRSSISNTANNGRQSSSAEDQCVHCRCNGSPSLCDPESGICTHCVNNTAGNHCQFCTFGSSGTPPFCHGSPGAASHHTSMILVIMGGGLLVCSVLMGFGWMLMRSHGPAFSYGRRDKQVWRPKPGGTPWQVLYRTQEDNESSAILANGPADGNQANLEGSFSPPASDGHLVFRSFEEGGYQPVPIKA